MSQSLASLATALSDYLTWQQAPASLRMALESLADKAAAGNEADLSHALRQATRAIRDNLASNGKSQASASSEHSGDTAPVLAKLFVSDGGEPFALPWPSSLARRWEASGYVGEPLVSAYANSTGSTLPVLTAADLSELRATWDRLHTLGESHYCRNLKPILAKLEADERRGLANLLARSAIPAPCADTEMPAGPEGATYGHGYVAGWSACRQALFLTLRQYPPRGETTGTPERITDAASLSNGEQHALFRLRNTLGVTTLDLADTLNRANTILRRQLRAERI